MENCGLDMLVSRVSVVSWLVGMISDLWDLICEVWKLFRRECTKIKTSRSGQPRNDEVKGR